MPTDSPHPQQNRAGKSFDRAGKSFDTTLMGDVPLHLPRVLPLQEMHIEVQSSSAKPQKASLMERSCRILHNALAQASEPCFCLVEVCEYFHTINREFAPEEELGLGHFEVWLSGRSAISHQEELEIRAKIAGKYLPRRAYQTYFPIGTSSQIAGSHIVTGHSSPDLDTAVASFWGWVDAFAAKVGSQVHTWNLPGGTLAPQDRLVFDDLFGPELLSNLPKTRTELSLNALDLVDTSAIICKQSEHLVTELVDRSGLLVWTDSDGYYLGEWRAKDAEAIGQVTGPLVESLLFVETQVQAALLLLIADAKSITREDLLEKALKKLGEQRLADLAPVRAFSPEQRAGLESFVQNLMHLTGGLQTSLYQLLEWAEREAYCGFSDFTSSLRNLSDQVNSLESNKSATFAILEKMPEIVRILNTAMGKARKYLSRLDVQVLIKQEVLGWPQALITARAGLEEVRLKTQTHEVLTCIYPETSDRFVALGAIEAKELRKTELATATVRDFCNREAVKIPPYIQVLSAMDHHAVQIRSQRVPVVSAADVQSCNVLLAESAFALNDQYGSAGLETGDIDAQLAELLEVASSTLSSKTQYLLQRLLTRKYKVQRGGDWYIHPARELAEYWSFLLAIFDDTDLLTKVTPRDVRCVVQLLNRAKSLQVGQEMQILSEGDLEEDENFAENLADRILRHPETHSVYSKVYQFRERSVEASILACAQGQQDIFFADTKEQNNCARIGQSKLFAQNYPIFSQNIALLRARWLAIAQTIYTAHTFINLHLHMCSTISGAEDVFKGSSTKECTHLDQIWFWLPEDELARENLAIFVSGLARSNELKGKTLELELINDRDNALGELVGSCFSNCRVFTASCMEFETPMFALHFPAGALNSRKASIAPHIPQMSVSQ